MIERLFSLMLSIGFVLVFEPAVTKSLPTEAITKLTTAPSFLRPCHVPNIDKEVRCGKYEVYEDRAAKSGRRISLNVVVVPALTTKPAKDPVFWLHGDPLLIAVVSSSV